MTWNPEDIYGYLHPDEGKVLNQMAKDGLVLEIGSFCGKSAVYMATVAKKVICIDPFTANYGGQGDEGFPVTVLPFLWATKDFKNVHSIVAKSTEVDFFIKDHIFDLLFIDGLHTYEAGKFDILHYAQKVKADGWIALHDYYDAFPDYMKAIEEYVDVSKCEKAGVMIYTKIENIRV